VTNSAKCLARLWQQEDQRRLTGGLPQEGPAIGSHAGRSACPAPTTPPPAERAASARSRRVEPHRTAEPHDFGPGELLLPAACAKGLLKGDRRSLPRHGYGRRARRGMAPALETLELGLDLVGVAEVADLPGGTGPPASSATAVGDASARRVRIAGRIY
jgi:hypothetical protein